MELKIDKTSCLKEELMIPKGYRLLEDWEVLKELRNNKKLRELLISDYVWCNNYMNLTKIVFLAYDSGDFLIGSYKVLLDNDGSARGVFVKVKQ
jgi:hypothetical protein